MFKKLLKLRIQHLILESFKKAEIVYRRGNGEACLNYATNYVYNPPIFKNISIFFIIKMVFTVPIYRNILHRIIMFFILPFKGRVKKILQEEFKIHADYINSMIIRERIKI